MTRRIVAAVWLLALASWSATADDATKELTPAERKALDAKAAALHTEGFRLYQAMKLNECRERFEESLRILRRLYPEGKYPDGHPDLATNLNNLAMVIDAQGKPAGAEPHFREALAMRRRLFPQDRYPDGHADLALSLNKLALVLQAQGKPAAAETLFRDALAMYQRLSPPDRYPDGHADFATCLNNLAMVLNAQGKPAAEPFSRDALAMQRRLYPNDKYPDGHSELAASLNNLATVLQAQGKVAAAELFFRDALTMQRRLFPPDKYPDGHPHLATSLSNLAMALKAQGKAADAEPLFRDALVMNQRFYPKEKYPDGHPHLTISLNSLGLVLQAQGKPAAAEPLFCDALAMDRRLFPDDKYPDGHRNLVRSLNNLGSVLNDQGKPAAAEAIYREVLAMQRRLLPKDKYPDGHADLAAILNSLAGVLHSQGKLVVAEPLLRDALDMYTALAREQGRTRPEGDVLTLLGSFPATRDGYLSLTLDRPAVDVYAVLWPNRTTVTRVLEAKHLAAHAATTPDARRFWADVTDLKRQRADLLLAPAPRDPDERKARDKTLEEWTARVAELERDLRQHLPALARSEALDRSIPADLQKVLPPDAAFVDLLRYTRFTFDAAKPGSEGETRTLHYVAFVVTRSAVARVELGEAAPIEAAVTAWREAIRTNAPDDASPATLRKLVWEPIVPHLPAPTRTVYLAPEEALTRVPWAALPGSKPGTVLLEDLALTTVPHGAFLLDRRTALATRPDPARGVLVVGGVAYDDAPTSTVPPATEATEITRAETGKWPALPGTAREAEAVASLAAARKLPIRSLSRQDASTTNVRDALPQARVAHFATHGFFADPKFRTFLRTDPELFRMQGRERVGAAAISPLVLSGLVFAGANRPDLAGRGLLTGEALVNLDLSGLDLAVLSACDTGLGDVAGGEGVFGLQKSFHVAGCKDVVASLWKVEDDATAALMTLFYRGLWVENLSPAESLRKAQLTIYRDPHWIPALARLRAAELAKNDLPKVAEPTEKGRTAPTRQWAAFTLSGLGR